MSKHHKVNKNLDHIEHKRGYVTDTKDSFFTEKSTDHQDWSHRTVEEKICYHIKQGCPDRLFDPNFVDNLIFFLESWWFLLFVSKSFHSSNIRKALLSQCWNCCFFILHNFLCFFHYISEKYRVKNDWRYRNQNSYCQFPRYDEKENEGYYYKYCGSYE